MATSDKSVNIQIEEKALKFIQSKRLKAPMILVNLGTRSGGGGCEGSGGCGGGSGEGGPSTSTPSVNVVMVDGGKPGNGFVKVDTQAGIPVYLAKPVFNMAKRSTNPLFITVKGLVMKRLGLEGLDLTASAGQNSQGESSCH